MAPLARQIESLRALNIDIDHLEVRGNRRLKYLMSIPSVWRRVEDVDLIHAHFGHSGLISRLQFQKPVVISFMGSDLLGTPRRDDGYVPPLSRLVARFYRQLARAFDAVIVKSPEMAAVVRPVRAHVIPNGVDFEKFRPIAREEARAALGWSQDKHYVLFPGSPFNPRKGFKNLAEPAVKIAAASLSKPVEIVILRRIAPEKVPFYMNACDVELMTSYIEGSPNVIKEALACNTPIISVPVGDVPMLLHGVESCAICPRTPEALAEQIVKTLKAGSRPRNGRELLQQRGLDMDSVARRILAIYKDTLAARQNGQAVLAPSQVTHSEE
jgi:glycosyltransferase involved in cell wall biosynthesis